MLDCRDVRALRENNEERSQHRLLQPPFPQVFTNEVGPQHLFLSITKISLRRILPEAVGLKSCKGRHRHLSIHQHTSPLSRNVQ